MRWGAGPREGTAPATVPQPLAPLVVERAPRWTALAQPAGMTLTTRVPPDLATYAPPDALGSLLDELVGNACRLSGGTRVEVTATADGPDAVVSVRDDGVGLSADERAHAGDRFWRGRRAEEVSGTGLGLAICRELAEAWGGRLTLSPAEGGGLVVDLTLPAAGQDLTERK